MARVFTLYLYIFSYLFVRCPCRAEETYNEMIKLKGGKFRMGTDSKDAKDGEGPSKLVHVKPFLIDKFPVTNENFRTFVREKKYKTDAEKFGWSFAFYSAVPKETLENIKQSVQVRTV